MRRLLLLILGLVISSNLPSQCQDSASQDPTETIPPAPESIYYTKVVDGQPKQFKINYGDNYPFGFVKIRKGKWLARISIPVELIMSQSTDYSSYYKDLNNDPMFTNTFFPVGFSEARNRCGYIDQTGKIIIPLIYDLCADFCNGIAPVGIYVSLLPNEGNVIAAGFVNDLNVEVIPPKYVIRKFGYNEFQSVDIIREINRKELVKDLNEQAQVLADSDNDKVFILEPGKHRVIPVKTMGLLITEDEEQVTDRDLVLSRPVKGKAVIFTNWTKGIPDVNLNAQYVYGEKYAFITIKNKDRYEPELYESGLSDDPNDAFFSLIKKIELRVDNSGGGKKYETGFLPRALYNHIGVGRLLADTNTNYPISDKRYPYASSYCIQFCNGVDCPPKDCLLMVWGDCKLDTNSPANSDSVRYATNAITGEVDGSGGGNCKYGFINAVTGKEIIPLNYDYVDINYTISRYDRILVAQDKPYICFDYKGKKFTREKDCIRKGVQITGQTQQQDEVIPPAPASVSYHCKVGGDQAPLCGAEYDKKWLGKFSKVGEGEWLAPIRVPINEIFLKFQVLMNYYKTQDDIPPYLSAFSPFMCGYIDQDGKLIIPIIYTDCSDFSVETDVFRTKTKNEISPDEQVLAKLDDNRIVVLEKNRQRVLPVSKNNNMVTKNEKEITPEMLVLSAPVDGKVVVAEEPGAHDLKKVFGFIILKNKEHSPPELYETEFSDKYSFAYFISKNEHLNGINGDNHARVFSPDYMPRVVANSVGSTGQVLIDTNTNMVISDNVYKQIFPSCGHYCRNKKDCLPKDCLIQVIGIDDKTGFINAITGKEVIPVIYDYVDVDYAISRYDRILVKRDEPYLCFDYKGKKFTRKGDCIREGAQGEEKPGGQK